MVTFAIINFFPHMFMWDGSLEPHSAHLWGPDVRRSSQVLKLDQVKRLRQIFCWSNNTQEFSSEKSGDTIVPYQFAISYLVVKSQSLIHAGRIFTSSSEKQGEWVLFIGLGM